MWGYYFFGYPEPSPELKATYTSEVLPAVKTYFKPKTWPRPVPRKTRPETPLWIRHEFLLKQKARQGKPPVAQTGLPAWVKHRYCLVQELLTAQKNTPFELPELGLPKWASDTYKAMKQAKRPYCVFMGDMCY